MPDRRKFDEARRNLSRAHERHTSICAPFLSVAPVQGAAVSVLSVRIGQSTVCASDDTAERLDELQFDLGEGPCWQALSTRLPVLTPDLRLNVPQAWPVFATAVREDPQSRTVEAIFAFPLAVGSLDIGAVDLYSLEPQTLTDLQISRLSELSLIAAWQVLRIVIADSPDVDADDSDRSPSSRREVHQATGMVLAQLAISAEDASVLLRAHAFATGRSVRDVASDIVARRIDFSEDGR